jgi:ATP-dependent Zn protease
LRGFDNLYRHQNRKMNAKMMAAEMAIFLQGRRAEEMRLEMRETLLRSWSPPACRPAIAF